EKAGIVSSPVQSLLAADGGRVPSIHLQRVPSSRTRSLLREKRLVVSKPPTCIALFRVLTSLFPFRPIDSDGRKVCRSSTRRRGGFKRSGRFGFVNSDPFDSDPFKAEGETPERGKRPRCFSSCFVLGASLRLLPSWHSKRRLFYR
ncbi:hypothetical protein BHM03_00044385, partial [Ensete ventricosum]